MTKGTKIVAKFAGRCGSRECGLDFPAGEAVVFYAAKPRGSRAWHVGCARIEALKSKIFAAGLNAFARGGADEAHWTKVERQLQAERDALVAARKARLEQAAGEEVAS